MKFRSSLSALIVLLSLQTSACQSWGKFWCTPDAISVECVGPKFYPGNAGNAVWTAGVTVAPSTSNFNGVATDSAGNVYVAGQQNGTGSYTYGNKTIAGLGSPNVVLVKYDANGVIQWAKTTSGGTNINFFSSVAVDSAGNVFAAGVQSVTLTYTYGSQTATGACNTGYNAVIVKYDSAGNALWARSSGTAGVPSTAPGALGFSAVATDSAGNAYAVGGFGTGTYVFGGQSTTSPSSVGGNAFIVKYDAAGNVIWARSTGAATGASGFNAVATDNLGYVYAAGRQNGNGSNTYDTQTAAASYAGGSNALLVKYDSLGNVQWVKSTFAGSDASTFYGVTTDGDRNIYAAGFQTGTGIFDYSGANVNGTNPGANALLVKYNSLGQAQWAKSTYTAPGPSLFNAVSTDQFGYVYAAGVQSGNGTYAYDAQTATGNYAGGNNVLLVKYTQSGSAGWARTTDAGLNVSQFSGITADTSGRLYAVGYQTNNTPYQYGTKSITTPFASGVGALLVAYE